MRKTLNSWFANYPVEHQSELRSAFLKSFEDCFYELFIHELFYKQGCEITIHPNLPGTTKKPDFLVKKGEIEFYAEAKNVRSATEDSKLAKRYGAFYDGLNIKGKHRFMLSISELTFKKESQPSVKRLTEYLRKDMERYEPEEVTRKMTDYENPEKALFQFETDEFKIEGSYIPFAIVPSEEIPLIGIYPPFDFLGDGHEVVTAALKKKIVRYGKPDKPYLICVNIMEVLAAGQLSAESVFWGSPRFSFNSRNPASTVQLTRGTDGIFWDAQGPRRTHVSAILLNRVSTSNLMESEYWMAKHPFASQELDLNGLRFGYTYLKDNLGEFKSGRSIFEILSGTE